LSTSTRYKPTLPPLINPTGSSRIFITEISNIIAVVSDVYTLLCGKLGTAAAGDHEEKEHNKSLKNNEQKIFTTL